MGNDVWLLIAILSTLLAMLLIDFVFKVARTKTELTILLIFVLGIFVISASWYTKYAKLCLTPKKGV